MSHNVHKFTLDVTYVQKGVQLVTKVCYYLEFSYIYKHLIINKKALCLIAEGCTSGVHITNCPSVTYAVLFSDTEPRENISAKAGIGLKGLREALVATQNDSPVNSGQTIVTNLRHYEALRNASSALESVRTSLLSGLTPDLIAEDLRQALHHLSAILGEVTPDEVLGNIFSRFCVGK